MRLGLSLALTQPRQVGAAAVYDPSVLAAELWLRAPFTSSPWTGTASAGGSGGRDASEATHPPTAGTAVNGYAPASFNGTNEKLAPPGTLATYIGATEEGGYALVKLNAIATNDPWWALNDHIIGTDGTGQWGVYMRANGGSPVVGVAHFNVTNQTVETAISTGAWQLVQWKYDGTNLAIRINGGTWTSAAHDAVSSEAASLMIGRDPGQSNYLDGDMLELFIGKIALSDATFDNILSYARARYALSLT